METVRYPSPGLPHWEQQQSLLGHQHSLLILWKFPVHFAARKQGIGLQAAPRRAFSGIGVPESG